MSSVQRKAMNKPKNTIHLDDQLLHFVAGQRGKPLLVLNGYTLATNLVVDKTTYWCCRHRTINAPPCHARAKTSLKPNGLYNVIISQPVHNHKPTFKTEKSWTIQWLKWNLRNFVKIKSIFIKKHFAWFLFEFFFLVFDFIYILNFGNIIANLIWFSFFKQDERGGDQSKAFNRKKHRRNLSALKWIWWCKIHRRHSNMFRHDWEPARFPSTIMSTTIISNHNVSTSGNVRKWTAQPKQLPAHLRHGFWITIMTIIRDRSFYLYSAFDEFIFFYNSHF